MSLSLGRCVWMSSTWRGPHRAQPQDGIGRPWAGPWVQVAMRSAQPEHMLHKPGHSTRKRRGIVGQQKRSVPFSNSLVPGPTGQLWMARWASNSMPLGPTYCHTMKIKSVKGQGCSIILARWNDKFGGSLLYPFEKGQILWHSRQKTGWFSLEHGYYCSQFQKVKREGK